MLAHTMKSESKNNKATTILSRRLYDDASARGCLQTRARSTSPSLRTMATMTVTVGGHSSSTSAKKETIQLYNEHGVPKKLGDAPLGIAYDGDGLPVPDWEADGRAAIKFRGGRGVVAPR